VKELKNKPIIVYPNSGEQYDAVSKTWSGTEGLEILADCSLEWYKWCTNYWRVLPLNPQQIQQLT
jgi:homocysteine S-methyltransferase